MVPPNKECIDFICTGLMKDLTSWEFSARKLPGHRKQTDNGVVKRQTDRQTD